MADSKISALADGTTPATTDAFVASRSGGTTVKLTWAEVLAASKSSPTAVKTGNYTAAAGDLVACDISGGSFTVTLPTAPADKTQVCVEIVNRVTTIVSHQFIPTYVTVATGGADVLFKASGATSGIMGRGSIIFQYNAAASIWYAPGTGDLLPTGWEFGYDEIVSDAVISATTEASGNTVITCAAHVFDGSPVNAIFEGGGGFSMVAGSTCVVSLFESTTQIGRLTSAVNNTALVLLFPYHGSFQFTPSAGSHTYTVTAFRATANTTLQAGAGGTGVNPPVSVRFTKV